MFLKNRNIIFKMKISKVTDYAAVNLQKWVTPSKTGNKSSTEIYTKKLKLHLMGYRFLLSVCMQGCVSTLVHKPILAADVLTLSLPVTTFAICTSRLLIFLGSLWIQIGLLPFEHFWSGFILLASREKSSLKCTLIYAADVKSRWHFPWKNRGRIFCGYPLEVLRMSTRPPDKRA